MDAEDFEIIIAETMSMASPRAALTLIAHGQRVGDGRRRYPSQGQARQLARVALAQLDQMEAKSD